MRWWQLPKQKEISSLRRASPSKRYLREDLLIGSEAQILLKLIGSLECQSTLQGLKSGFDGEDREKCADGGVGLVEEAREEITDRGQSK